MRIGILGCGQMGENILKGLINTDSIDPSTTVLTTKFDDHEAELEARYSDMTVTQDNNKAVKNCDLLILAVHPGAAKDLLLSVKNDLKGKILISICAGITIEQLLKWAPGVEIVRAMPNTPCLIGEGMVALSAKQSAEDKTIKKVKALFDNLGMCLILDEKYLDTVTALSASGPAFAFVILEAMADGAVMMGLPRQVALKLTSQMFQGAARLQLQTSMHPAALKDQVTTPGGITTAGLLVMEDGRIRSTLARTIQTAASKAKKINVD